MARITAQQLRFITNRDRHEKVIDQILEDATKAAMMGETELAISPIHIFTVKFEQAERDQIKLQLEALGFELEKRVLNEKTVFWVLKW